MGGGSELRSPELFSWSKQVGLRAYEATKAVGQKVGEVEGTFPARVAVYHIRRAGALLEVSQDTLIEPSDILVLGGKYVGLIHAPDIIGREVDVSEVIDMIGESLDVCVLNSAVVGKTLGDIARNKGAHGIFLARMTRQGHDLPILADTVINKCDILQLVGTAEDVERAAQALGYPERPTSSD